jgi:membrane protein required for colicin V production
MAVQWNWLDVVLVVPLLYWFYQGFRKGLLWELFSLLGVAIGLLLALKLGQYAVDYFQSFIERFPFGMFLLYLLLFVSAFWLVLLIGKLVERFVKAVRLELLNQIAGGLLAVLKGGLLLSMILWMIGRFSLLDAELRSGSLLFPMLEPMAPWLYQNIGDWVPIFKNVIADLEQLIYRLVNQLDATQN